MFWKLPAAKHLMQFRSPIQGLIIRGEIWGESQIKALQIKGDTSLYINTQTKKSFSFWFAKFLLVVHFNNHVVSVLIPYATWGSVLTLAVSFLRNKISENIFALFSRISLESYDLRMDSPVLQPVICWITSGMFKTLNTMPHQPTRTCVSQSYVLCKTLEVMALKCYESFSPSLPSNPIYNPPLYLCVSTGRAPAHRSKLCPSFAALLSDFFVSQNFLPLSLALSSFWYLTNYTTALPLHFKQKQLQTHLVVDGCITWI